MRYTEKDWLTTLLVGLAGLALACRAEGQVMEIAPPPLADYGYSDPQLDAAAPPSAAPALGRGRAWLLTRRQGERAPLWRPWRRGAAGGIVDDGSITASPHGEGARPWFRGQFLSRGMAAIGRMRENSPRGDSAQPAKEEPQLDIDLGMPADDLASSPGEDAPYGIPDYEVPAYGVPAYGAPAYTAPQFGPQDAGVVGSGVHRVNPAPSLPQVPPDMPETAPELNIEIDAPVAPDHGSAPQRSVLAPGRSQRGR